MVAENTTRRVDIILSAKDGASPVLDRTTMNVQRLKAEANESIFGPAVKPRFGEFEQEARDIAAGKLRAMRAAEERARLQERARAILDETTPQSTPLRVVNRSADDQAFRDAMAHRIRSMRETARQASINERVDVALFGGSQSAKAAHAAGAEAGEGYSKGFIESIKKTFGRGSTFQESAELLQGGGAFIGGRIAIEMETRAVEGLTEALHKANEGTFEWNAEMIRSLPIMGDLIASSGHLYAELGKFLNLPEPVTAFLSGGFSLVDKENAKRAAETERVNRAVEQQQKIESIRSIAQNANEGGRSSADQRVLIGRTGEGQELEQNLQQTGSELDRIKAEREKLENATITTDKKIIAERAAAMAALDQEAREVLVTSEAKAAEIRKRYAKQREEDTKASEQRINDIRSDTHQKALQSEGFAFTAQLAQLKDNYDKQIREIDEGEKKKIEAAKSSGREQDIPTIQQEATNQRNALGEQYRQAANVAREQENRDAEESERQHAQAILDIRTKTAAENLRMMGRDAEAEQLELKAAYERRLAEIKANMDKEIQLHAERSDEIKRQAAEDAAAAKDEYSINSESARLKREKQFAPDAPSALGESRLLTGTLGEGATNPLIQPVERTAKASEKVADLMKQVDNKLADLVRLFPLLNNQPQVLAAN
jgi:hypothetical protein